MTSENTCSGKCGCAANNDAAAPTIQAQPGEPLICSEFVIPGMDCPTEEQMIRLRLADAPIASLQFDLPERRLRITHSGDPSQLLERLVPLGFGASLVASSPLDTCADVPANTPAEAHTLWLLLAINALMFVIEIIAGWVANSAGLIADGADMFADAAVYGVALLAVGKSALHQRNAARLAGVLQLLLGLAALLEAGRRAWTGSFPEEMTMLGTSLLALAANIACLWLVSRHRHGGVHMRASYIFSANDVLANLGVIAAAGLVALTGSPLPDWLIGGLIGGLVLAGAFKILRLR